MARKRYFPKTKGLLLPEGSARYVKVTRGNFNKLAEWCGGVASNKVNPKTKERSGHKISSIKTPKGIRTAVVGDIITRRSFRDDKTGMNKVEYTVIKAEDFAKFVLI